MGNSVIYRPAYDAEVEYLESTGTQWIDTGVKPDNTYTFDCKVAKIQSNYNCVFWGTRNSGESTTFNEQCYLNTNDVNDPSSVTKFAEINLFSTSIEVVESNWNSGITPIVNTMYELTGMTVVSTMNQMTYPITLFGFNMIGVINPSFGICRIGYWKCYSNGVLVRDMIPVRIGSVGYMYDKVSKQLFANKGTGNFILGNDVSNAVIPQQRCVLYFGNQRSVGFERIYEEYEWLGTDSGSPRITLQEGYNTDENAFIETTYKCQYQNPNVDMAIGFGITGSNAGIRVFNALSSVVVIDVHRRTNGTHTAKRIYGHNGQIGVPRYLYVSLTEYRVDDISGSITLNENFDENVGVGASSIYTNDHSNDVWYKETKLRANNITYDLIPCRLLQSIPAILDGNGIARQAGECGMWDKISNKFYGNVANSGTFTVKGPKCYEEYKWLNQTIPIGVNTGSIPIPDGFEYTLKYSSIGNTPHITCSRHTYFSPSMTLMGIYNILDDGSASITNWTLVSLGELKVKDTGTSILFNDNELPRFNSSYLITSSNANNGQEITVRQLSTITIDGSVRYVPCKLTHGIPASMDANGISRPAGTCGMWDKVNDVFYGNVANSGSFTVSND